MVLNNNYLSRRVPYVYINPAFTKFNRVEVAKDGVMRPSYQYVEYTSQEAISSSEFSLGNLIAIGAIDGMHYVSMSLNSDMNFVDEFAKSYQSITSDVQESSKS